MLTGDDEEDNEDPEPEEDEDDEEESQESMRNALEDADDNIGEALGNLDTAAMFADDPAKLTIKRAGSLLTMARELVTSCSDEGAPKSEPDEGEETFGIPDLEPDEVDAIHDSLTEAERERCCESGNEAIASIDEALDYTGRHHASLVDGCEDGGYRDGVKAALEELKKARRLLARLLEDYPF